MGEGAVLGGGLEGLRGPGELWDRPDVRALLAERDIAELFRCLQRVGLAQRRIAALTGQSQSEISEILGGRRVVAYDVLARIAEGLGIPRGYLGLAYDVPTARTSTESVGAAEQDKRDLPPRAGFGAAYPATQLLSVDLTRLGQPDRIGLAEVSRVEAVTAEMWALYDEFGGGVCRGTVVAHIDWVRRLWRARVSDQACWLLHHAVADLYVLAGWASLDTGRSGEARRYLIRASEHARFANEPSLVATAYCVLGTVHRHYGWHGEALRLLRQGQMVAHESGLARAVGMVGANLAWVEALLGVEKQAVADLARARDELARTGKERVPSWLRRFDAPELDAVHGMALASLPTLTSARRAEAIERLTASASGRRPALMRSRSLDLTALAGLLLDHGAADEAVKAGNEAIDLAERVSSTVLTDRMTHLREKLAQYPSDPGLRDVLERVKALQRRAPA